MRTDTIAAHIRRIGTNLAPVLRGDPGGPEVLGPAPGGVAERLSDQVGDVLRALSATPEVQRAYRAGVRNPRGDG